MKWTNFVKYINKLNRGKNEIIQNAQLNPDNAEKWFKTKKK